MAKYLLLKHYRGAPAPVNNVPMDQWTPEEVEAHIRFKGDFAARPPRPGAPAAAPAPAPAGARARHDGVGCVLFSVGLFVVVLVLFVGWLVFVVVCFVCVIVLAGELSAAPGAGGKPIYEWLEVRPFLTAPPAAAGDPSCHGS